MHYSVTAEQSHLDLVLPTFGFGFGMGLSVKVCSILFRTDKNLYSKRQIENIVGKDF